MTGREMILYILMNNLEDAKISGWVTPDEFAEKHNVGVATVHAWIELERVNHVCILDKVYIEEDLFVGENHG